MKTCRLCGEDKQEDEFYLNPKHSCGLDSRCKVCACEQVKAARARKPEHYKDYDRKRLVQPKRIAYRAAYVKSDHGKLSHKLSNQRYYDAHPERKAANLAVTRAIRDGRLIKQPCFICGELIVEGHHPDYSQHLDVVWLCVKHHKQLHREHKNGGKCEN